MKMNNYLKVNLGTVNNIKLVIGNGFDLACGLKSSYGDFFNYSRNIFDGIENWILNKNKYPFDGTAWDLYFYLLSKNNNLGDPKFVNWTDIESWMYKSFKPEYNFPFSFDTLGKINSIEQRILDQYFIDKNINIDNKKESYKFLMDELIRFENRFANFLKPQQEDENYNENVKRMLTMDGLFKFYDSNSSRKYLISIDTFNYTTPKYFNELKDVSIRHINGKIGSAIFGIDSDGIGINDEAYIFTKANRKILGLINGERENFKRNYHNLIVFGHSFSKADYSYFFPIIDSLDVTEYNTYGKRFIIGISDYFDNEIDNNKNREKIIESITKLLNAYDEYSLEINAKRVIRKLSEMIDSCDKNSINNKDIILKIQEIINAKDCIRSNRYGIKRQSTLELLIASDRIGFYKIDNTKLIKTHL